MGLTKSDIIKYYKLKYNLEVTPDDDSEYILLNCFYLYGNNILTGTINNDIMFNAVVDSQSLNLLPIHHKVKKDEIIRYFNIKDILG